MYIKYVLLMLYRWYCRIARNTALYWAILYYEIVASFSSFDFAIQQVNYYFLFILLGMELPYYATYITVFQTCLITLDTHNHR